MALTIATGFVVDDAIVVTENISRHIEKGMSPVEAALLGSREIGFTVLFDQRVASGRFIPILLMGGVVGMLFREFAIVLTTAIGISLVVSWSPRPCCVQYCSSRKTISMNDANRCGAVCSVAFRPCMAGRCVGCCVIRFDNAGQPEHGRADPLLVYAGAQRFLSAAGYGPFDGQCHG